MTHLAYRTDLVAGQNSLKINCVIFKLKTLINK